MGGINSTDSVNNNPTQLLILLMEGRDGPVYVCDA